MQQTKTFFDPSNMGQELWQNVREKQISLWATPKSGPKGAVNNAAKKGEQKRPQNLKAQNNLENLLSQPVVL